MNHIFFNSEVGTDHYSFKIKLMGQCKIKAYNFFYCHYCKRVTVYDLLQFDLNFINIIQILCLNSIMPRTPSSWLHGGLELTHTHTQIRPYNPYKLSSSWPLRIILSFGETYNLWYESYDSQNLWFIKKKEQVSWFCIEQLSFPIF